MRKIERILYAQNQPFLDEHRHLVLESGITERFGSRIEFVSQPFDIGPREHFDVVITPTLSWLPDLLERSIGVQWIHFLSSGVDRIWSMDVDWAEFRLTSSKGVHAIPISEYVLGAMLHFAKRFDQYVAQASEGVWLRNRAVELADADVVIVGGGSIGRAVAGLVRAFGARPRLVARTARTDAEFGDVHGLESLPEVLGGADYLVLALPLTAETRGLMNRAHFRDLKPSCVLVDVSRGGIVVTEHLVEALDSGHLRGAALDVFREEPLPRESPLWGRENVLVTPHVAGTSPRYIQRALEIFCSNAEQYVADKKMGTQVDIGLGY